MGLIERMEKATLLNVTGRVVFEDGERLTAAAAIAYLHEEAVRLSISNTGAVDLLRRLLATSDPLPPDGVDIHVEALRFLDDREDAA